MAYSVMRPMAMPIITHRPLLISFFFVQPNTLQGLQWSFSKQHAGSNGTVQAVQQEEASEHPGGGRAGVSSGLSVSSQAGSGLDVLICTQSPTQKGGISKRQPNSGERK